MAYVEYQGATQHADPVVRDSQYHKPKPTEKLRHVQVSHSLVAIA